MRNILANLIVTALLLVGVAHPAFAVTDTSNGDWSQQQVTLKNTPEAALMVRVGDINNLGFGWPTGFDPFSGKNTPAHNYPWTPPAGALPGLDRIMVISSYQGMPPAGYDGYTATTSRPANSVQDITLSYDLSGIAVQAAVLQLFVDDFQATVWQASYQATLNGTRAPFLESVINSLNQTGPIGKLVSVLVPADFLPQIATGKLVLRFDDPVSGAGDGYAIDFVKLLVNPVGYAKLGTVTGKVTDSSGKPLANATVSAAGLSTATTDATGNFTLLNVPAGLASISVSLGGYATTRKNVDVVAGQSQSVSFSLTVRSDIERLLNWAEYYDPIHFPSGSATQTVLGYTFRYYPVTGIYLGSSPTGRVIVHDGKTWNLFDVGAVTDFLPMALAAGF
ncbi:MAG: carboxypeptidase regulatory-like domain-containing protein [Sulfuricella sp.]|nr:carboxypeptidase regulatory-like domain-containing protein [Sulfuricella sp.]